MASIFDIRRGESNVSILEEMRKSLDPQDGSDPQMPTMLLYDEAGLRLFEEITYLDEYYLTNAEINIFNKHATSIASRIQPGSSVIELGSGNLRKVSILLDAFELLGKDIDYYALDLCKAELERTLASMNPAYQHVRCFGLHGDYEDGVAWLQEKGNHDRPTCILWIGSSIGNFRDSAAVDFLQTFSSLMNPQDALLIGVDACQDPEKVYLAYNDAVGKTTEFYMNGLLHANKLIGHEAFKANEWESVGTYDRDVLRHEAFYIPKRDVAIEKTLIPAGTKVKFEESNKYPPSRIADIWRQAGLVVGARYENPSDDYHLHFLTLPKLSFQLKSLEYAPKPVPSLAEFEQLWLVWDTVTRYMIPQGELLSKPINLRNCCLFYLGHIPAFLDIHLTRATGEAATDPVNYHRIFERGIDPDVENPELCHAHSEIPDEWPPIGAIFKYQECVRQRTRRLYQGLEIQTDRKMGRALWLGFEHEVMHLETLLYMLLQSDKMLPPPGPVPDFERLATEALEKSVPNKWIKVPANTIRLGLNDVENDEGPDRYFGWDNEKPERYATVPTFEAKARPVTVGEYAYYLQQTNGKQMPASWFSKTTQDELADISRPVVDDALGDRMHDGTNGHVDELSDSPSRAFLSGKFIRTVYGPLPLKLALAWPVFASYDELVSCALWMGGRIPTQEEVRSIYDFAQDTTLRDTDSILTKKISAVNGHLSNDGVEISPPEKHLRNGAVSGAKHRLIPDGLFTDLEGCNVGFQHFHPTPVTQSGHRLSRRGDLGGVWEWTSSVLDRHEGFQPMGLYPAYTDDFFDGKHNIVLGGSWATHPRIAGRKSFVNWYQRNYPYAWCGARLVRDVSGNQ